MGRHTVQLSLHPEIETSITVIVARNNEEAARIERGEDVRRLREEPTEEEAATLAAEAFFEPEAAESLRAREGEEAEPAATADKS
jgi:large subunit ribosomal protein L9